MKKTVASISLLPALLAAGCSTTALPTDFTRGSPDLASGLGTAVLGKAAFTAAYGR
ncbi:MAG TPA: hypothetical protein PKB14_14620 [Rubrivivax sp.]|nr:hypothetical protein [Rubrivivax sp.]